VRVEGSKRVREIMNGTQQVYLLNLDYIIVYANYVRHWSSN
jgi:hypothetical protein